MRRRFVGVEEVDLAALEEALSGQHWADGRRPGQVVRPESFYARMHHEDGPDYSPSAKSPGILGYLLIALGFAGSVVPCLLPRPGDPS